jgi:hypothetical protein
LRAIIRSIDTSSKRVFCPPGQARQEQSHDLLICAGATFLLRRRYRCMFQVNGVIQMSKISILSAGLITGLAIAGAVASSPASAAPATANVAPQIQMQTADGKPANSLIQPVYWTWHHHHRVWVEPRHWHRR